MNNDWDEETPIPLSHPLVPQAIRDASAARSLEECALHRVSDGETIEWWVFDADGELVEAFWLE